MPRYIPGSDADYWPDRDYWEVVPSPARAAHAALKEHVRSVPEVKRLPNGDLTPEFREWASRFYELTAPRCKVTRDWSEEKSHEGR